jgi:hypothetical protein
LSANKFKGVNGYIEGQTIKIHKRYGKTFEEPGTTVNKIKMTKTEYFEKQRDSLDSSDIRIKKWWKTLRNLSVLPCNTSRNLSGLPCNTSRNLSGLPCNTSRNLSGLPCNTSNYPPLLLNDTCITKDIEKANAFNDYFCQQS